jgi:hypothetical protein
MIRSHRDESTARHGQRCHLKRFLSVCALTAFTTLATAFVGAASGQTSLDRQSFFDTCSRVVSERKSFQAMDRGKNTTFFLRRTVIEGTGKDNVNRIFDQIERLGAPRDRRQIAYILATAYRETIQTLQPIREGYPCRTEECIHKYVKGAYAQPAENGHSYYGRGFVQLTHRDKYLKVGRLLGMKPITALHDKPDLALDPDIAARILVEGMIGGWFTGHRLSDYFNETTEDWNGGRQIVNPGSSRAPITAGFGKLFLECVIGGRGESLPGNP